VKISDLKCPKCGSEDIEACLDIDVVYSKNKALYVQVPFCCRKCGVISLAYLKEVEKIEVLE